MEREDNAQLDNYLQNSQNLVENMQIAGGAVCGDVGGFGTGGEIGGIGIGSGIGSNIGGKFEEHGDDDEGWKYLQEKRQSEKQQAAINHDAGGEEVVGNGRSFGDDLLLGLQENDGSALQSGVHAASAHFTNATGAEDDEVDIIRNDGDFSTTSNTNSTAGEDIAVDGLQVEMKIETMQPEHYQQLPHEQHQQHRENIAPQFSGETEEDESSSLATNTTNGTSSLSENIPIVQQHHHQHQQEVDQLLMQPEAFTDVACDGLEENNENVYQAATADNKGSHGVELNSELHSVLNPNAREFVPNFGSKPTSPTSPAAGGGTKFGFDVDHVGEPAALKGAVDTEFSQPHPTAVPHHLLVDDDLVAESPRKGSGCDMDTILLPPETETEFEHEADQRPHEVLQYQFEQNLSHNGNESNLLAFNEVSAEGGDSLDFQQQPLQHSPASLIDHGPETSVDQDGDLDVQPTDIMKQSIYVENPVEHIEDVLNTVQPLPLDNDSLNNSFCEDIEHDIAMEKELLQVEEKERVSQSPSMEDLQMNLQQQYDVDTAAEKHASHSHSPSTEEMQIQHDDLHASAKDIAQIPIDMNTAGHMEDSLYLENTSSQAQHEEVLLAQPEYGNAGMNQFDTQGGIEDISFDTPLQTAPTDIAMSEEPVSLGAATDLTQESISIAEKHLVEDTKEQPAYAPDTKSPFDELEQKFDDFQFGNDGHLSQIEEVGQVTTITTETENLVFTQQSTQLFDEPIAEEHQHQAFDFMRNEPTNFDEHPQQVHNDQLLQFEHNEPIFQTEAVSPAATEQIPESNVEHIVEPVELAVEALVTPEVVVEKVPIDSEATVPIIQPAAVSPEPEVSPIVAVATTVAATAVAATVALKASGPKKSLEPTKKPSGTSPVAGKSTATATAKPKVSDTKKPTESKKSTGSLMATKATTSTTSARPRTAPAKTSASTATTVAKKPLSTTSAVGAKQPPVSSAFKKSTASVPLKTSVSKTSTTTTTSTTTKTGVASKPAAPRAAGSSTMTSRKPLTVSNSTTGAATATNGATTKPARPSTAPAKPTSLQISNAAKPKLSPRATLTSQLRNSAPGAGAAPAKSPTKTASVTNGHTSKTTVISKTRAPLAGNSTTTTTTTTTTTKTFTARPAPKTTGVGATTMSSATRRVTAPATLGSKASTQSLKKSPSSKPATTLGANKVAPISKSSGTSVLKTKTKEGSKSVSPMKKGDVTAKKSLTPKTNGAMVMKEEIVNGTMAPELQQHQNGVHDVAAVSNGGADHVLPEQNASAPEVTLIDA